jgi:ubiquinone biosynthesis protein
MVDWNLLIDEDAFAALLPGEYARFARPVRGALTVFLGGLPAAHQEAILADQAALPPPAAAPDRLFALAHSCPALHKLGQVLARDRRLAPELRRRLQGLESLPPSVPVETIRDILTRELGPPDRLGVTLAPAALAEASVAVVIPFRRDRAPRDGVFKVLKPRIEERLEQELQLLQRVGSYLDERCAEFGLPNIDYGEVFEQVRLKLREEVRLDIEQRNLARARAFYEGEPRVQIPALFEHCTPRVTAMERVTGGKITDHGPALADEGRRLADLLVEALVARPIFAKDSPAPFHADPHAGNLFLTEGRCLAVLDWSLVGWMGDAERVGVVQLLLAATLLDAGRIVSALEGLAGRVVDRTALESVVHASLRRLRRGQFPGFAWLAGLLDAAVRTARLRIGPDLLLFRKSLHTLQGVMADLGAGEGRVGAVLLAQFLRCFAAEWPQRWLAWPDSPAFATRLSNGDLAGWMLNLPWAASRFWLDQMLDLLSAGAQP